jgi:hypothetical protein
MIGNAFKLLNLVIFGSSCNFTDPTHAVAVSRRH